ncbi:MAG: SIS domain-containing protein [Actinomycetota bacterium]
MPFAKLFLEETATIAASLDGDAIDAMAEKLAEIRNRKGRVFFIGVGGGAGHASHAVCDFRKIAGIEAYTPLDNVSELTARINDDGWDGALVSWLRTSNLSKNDGVFVFSVGGGDAANNVSVNLVEALKLAQEVGASIFGVVGRDGGYTAEVADVAIVVPTVNKENITAHTEGFQAVVWHLLVAHPLLRANQMKWESMPAK